MGYILGVARNGRLEAAVSLVELALAEQYADTGNKQREIASLCTPPIAGCTSAA